MDILFVKYLFYVINLQGKHTYDIKLSWINRDLWEYWTLLDGSTDCNKNKEKCIIEWVSLWRGPLWIISFRDSSLKYCTKPLFFLKEEKKSLNSAHKYRTNHFPKYIDRDEKQLHSKSKRWYIDCLKQKIVVLRCFSFYHHTYKYVKYYQSEYSITCRFVKV